MPEGDTIWRTAAALRPRLVGETLRDVQPSSLHRVRGRSVLGVEPRGKHLLIRFEGGLALHSHMRMTGSWHIYDPGERWWKPASQARAVLTFDQVVAVAFNAPVIELVRDDDARVEHLGPDILGDDFAMADVLARVRAGAGERTIGEVLLDQRLCAGIGNIHRCDALWACRLSPWEPVAQLGDDEIAAVYAEARRRMQAGAGVRGLPGNRPLGVHGHAGRACPRCGRPISVASLGDPFSAGVRMVFWCPGCQGESPVTGAASSKPGAKRSRGRE